MPQLKVQNFYSTALTSDIVGTGDASFTVTVAPTFTSGFLVISPNNASLREIVYFHNVVGNTVSVRAENRGQGGTTARSHTSQEPVAMKDIAEIFNMFSDSISQCFFVEKTGGLTIKVWGGTVFYNGNPVTVADTALTLADNQTNYIKYSYPTNTISVDTTNSGNIKARVTTVSGVITSIQYYVAKESYIDFTVTITGALPSQTGKAGKALITDGTNVSWGIPNGVRSGMQSNTTNDALLVIGKTKLPIVNGDFAIGSGTQTTGGAWIGGVPSYGWYVNGTGGSISASYDTGRMKLQTVTIGSYVEVGVSAGYYPLDQYAIAIEPNTTYTIDYDMETSLVSGTSNDGAFLQACTYDAAGGSVAEYAGTKIQTTTTNTHYQLTFTSGANTRYLNPQMRIYGHTGTGSLNMSAWFDNIVVTCVSNEIVKSAPIASSVSILDKLITEKQDGTFQKTPVSLLLPSFDVGIPSVEAYNSTDLLSVVSLPAIATTPEVYYPVGESSSNLITSIDCYSTGVSSTTFQVWISKSAGLTSGNVSFRITQSDGTTLVNANATVTVAATSLTNNANNTITFPGSFSCGTAGTNVKFQACVNTFASPTSSNTNYFGLGMLKAGADNLGFYSGSAPEGHFLNSTYNGTFTVNKDVLLTRMDGGVTSIDLKEDGGNYITVTLGTNLTIPVLLKTGKTYTWSGSGTNGVGSFWRSGAWTNGPDIASMTQFMPEFGGGTQMFRVWNVYTAPITVGLEYITLSTLTMTDTIQRAQPYPKYFKNLIGYPTAAGIAGSTPKIALGKKSLTSTTQGTTYYPSTNGTLTTSVNTSFIAPVGVGLPGNVLDLDSPHGVINSYTYTLNNTSGADSFSNAFYIREALSMTSTITAGTFVLQRWINGEWTAVYTVSATGSKSFPARGLYRVRVPNTSNISVILELT